jgi:leader peptidase (prepilin peptidase)/N-methyltransferase
MLDQLFFAAPGTWLPAAVAGIFGLLIGSFLNVVIHRLPRMMQREADNYLALDSESEGREAARKLGSSVTSITYVSEVPLPNTEPYNLTLPRSACPVCKHKITASENIPVLSYLALGGKCSECKTPISVRYPIVELITGAFSVVLIWQFGSGWLGLSTLLFTYLLIAMSFIDADTQFLPDTLTYPLLWAGLLANTMGLFVPLNEAVIGAVAGYLVLWIVRVFYQVVRKQEGMGGGDLILLAALGAWLGWKMLPLIVLLSSFVGAVVGLSLIAFKGRDFQAKIPFGPYLAGAGWIALIYGNSILQMWLQPH